MKTVIVYGSMTGTTETVAQNLATELHGEAVNAVHVDAKTLEGCDLLILGASTWGMGDLQDDMAEFLPEFSKMDLSIPYGAVFGLGDQTGYTDTYVDGIADMANALESKGIKRIGNWSADGYDFAASRAQVGDTFTGLAIDEDNESDKTAERLSAWAKQLKEEAGA